ncbi:hypothetical protein TKK_0006812 [Trichogramma kaykai]
MIRKFRSQYYTLTALTAIAIRAQTFEVYGKLIAVTKVITLSSRLLSMANVNIDEDCVICKYVKNWPLKSDVNNARYPRKLKMTVCLTTFKMKLV